MEDLFNACFADIENNSTTLGHTLGYRFLLCPKSTFNTNTDVLFMGPNPGGNCDVKEHPKDSCEQGCAFYTEKWSGYAIGKSPLQKQVQSLFYMLNIYSNNKCTDIDFANKNILSAYFIPYRSSSLSTLTNKTKTMLFSQNLWMKILTNFHPKLILAMGNDTYNGIIDVLVNIGFHKKESINIDSGWGSVQYVMSTFQKDDSHVCVGRIPQLSRYKIFSRAQCKENVELFLKHCMKTAMQK